MVCVKKNQKVKLESLSELLKSQLNVEKFNIIETEKDSGLDQLLELKELGAEIIVNIAASPFSYNQDKERKLVLLDNASKTKLPIVYCNHVGAKTELIFDGGSFFMNQSGKVAHQESFFKECLLINDLNVKTGEFEQKGSSSQTKIALIHDALVLGIKEYFKKLGFKQAIVGLSGGIDSAVTFALAARALGNKNVYGILMPSQYSSKHSVDDAKDDKLVGKITSAVYSPRLKKNIALAMVTIDNSILGTELDIKVLSKNVKATVVEKPTENKQPEIDPSMMGMM